MVPKKACCVGGGERDRTDDLRLAKPALSQLSYAPGFCLDTLHQAPRPFAYAKCVCSLQQPGSCWWAEEDLNLRPHAYQARALTN
jgi:hypothetical protein